MLCKNSIKFANVKQQWRKVSSKVNGSKNHTPEISIPILQSHQITKYNFKILTRATKTISAKKQNRYETLGRENYKTFFKDIKILLDKRRDKLQSLL